MISRVDANQSEIVQALRAAGCSVQSLASVRHGCPDVLAGRDGANYVLEIKSPTGTLTSAERQWQADWRGQVAVVRSVEEALHAVGVLL